MLQWCSSLDRNTHLTCWQEVLTGAKGNVLDLQRVQRELQQLDQRVPDSTCLEMMWSVVARGLQHYVSEVKGRVTCGMGVVSGGQRAPTLCV